MPKVVRCSAGSSCSAAHIHARVRDQRGPGSLAPDPFSLRAHRRLRAWSELAGLLYLRMQITRSRAPIMSAGFSGKRGGSPGMCLTSFVRAPGPFCVRAPPGPGGTQVTTSGPVAAVGPCHLAGMGARLGWAVQRSAVATAVTPTTIAWAATTHASGRCSLHGALSAGRAPLEAEVAPVTSLGERARANESEVVEAAVHHLVAVTVEPR